MHVDRNEVLSKPGLVGLVFYSISNLVLDHLKPQFSALKAAEIALCQQLWEKRVCTRNTPPTMKGTAVLTFLLLCAFRELM